MFGQWRFLAIVMLGGTASAAPVPPPPQDFPGAQYIDGRGCVFTRADTVWTARVDGQGQPLCGFPPSLEVRRTDPDTERVLPVAAPAAPPDPEALLIEQLSRELRTGEWTSDPRPAEARAAPQPARRPDPIEAVLRDALAAAPALRQASGLWGSPELCARLGYRTDPQMSSRLPGLGLCSGMQAGPALAALQPAVRQAAATSAPRPAARQAAAASAPKPASAGKEPRTNQTAAAARPAPAAGRAGSQTPAARPKPVDGPEMIPPSARYVQVGAYADDDTARIVLRTLAGRGYATGQSRRAGGDKPLRVIMAGPFADRQALITALNDLRRNGYPGAVAR